MTTIRTAISATLTALAVAAGGALALYAPAQADAAVRDAAAPVASAADETPVGARGSITFRGQRYVLSDRAVVSTTPTTIRIADDAAMTQQGVRTSFYVHLGYQLDAAKPTIIRVSSGIAIRGYDFATGAHDPSQAIALGQGALSIDSPDLSQASHVWGHLSSATERGIELDIHGVHLGAAS